MPRSRRGPPGCWRRRSGASCSRRRAKFLISRSALSASSSSHAWRSALRTLACKGLARRSVMLRRALWTWQTLDRRMAAEGVDGSPWTAPWPQVDDEQACSTAASRPRPTRLSSSACTTAGILEVAPSITSEGMLARRCRRCRRRPACINVLIDVDAVNLDDQQITDLDRSARHPLLHALRRQRHEPARYRRLGHWRAPSRRGHVALRQRRTARHELARRDD